ncbi:hypothetical protein ES711_10375 [Gelidibacter salicanalis]|uniref:Uncharacterized protein n=1 Tax=Gelidibacter salicanalis TaxID=291193 RepID=A0A5C7AH03_9FLAO|nr:hypothetical protein [Gelidibacter salicanalis]TXE07828.1 hypothetical protein ES711_10375 [Gelidibacter salicanalis]
MSENKFDIGDIITLKSHPLVYQEDGLIDAYVNQIPPLMCVKEVYIERKKQLYSNELIKAKIADNVKYLCAYFNQHRMIFEEAFLYQDCIVSIKDLTFHSENEEVEQSHKKLIDETLKYSVADYEFGKKVFFKTYKIEKRKKFKTAGQDAKSSTRTTLTHTSPAFILNGYKANTQKSQFCPKSGELQRKSSEELYKIIWYNSFQEKFSEEYLPKEFFTDDSLIYENIKKIQKKKNNTVSNKK